MNFFTKFTDSLRNFGLRIIRSDKRLLNKANDDLVHAQFPASLFDVETLFQSIKDTVKATQVVVTSIGKFIKQTSISHFNRTAALFSAIKLAQQPAALGFLTVLGLGLTSSIAVALSTLLVLLIPLLIAATKAAIFAYPLFLAGVIALKIKEQCQTKEAATIAMLPPDKLCLKRIETIPNELLITPPSASAIFLYRLTPKAPTWQQQILNEIRLNLTENQPANTTSSEPQYTSPTAETFAEMGKDTTLRHEPKSINNQLAFLTIGWQAISQTATLLDAIKASEMKSIASALQIPRYRNMNKTQLLLAITEAFDQAPAFSQFSQ